MNQDGDLSGVDTWFVLNGEVGAEIRRGSQRWDMRGMVHSALGDSKGGSE